MREENENERETLVSKTQSKISDKDKEIASLRNELSRFRDISDESECYTKK